MTLYKSQSPEWLEARSKVVTATQFASLVGLSPHKKIISKTSNMKWGRILETAVIAALNEIGLAAEPAAPWGMVNFLDNGKLGASLDSKVLNHPVECKTTSDEKWQTWKKRPPLNYLLQIYVAMYLLNSEGYIACLSRKLEDEPKLIVYKCNHNLDLYNVIQKTIDRYYDKTKKFRVNSKDKERIKEIIYDKIELVYLT